MRNALTKYFNKRTFGTSDTFGPATLTGIYAMGAVTGFSTGAIPLVAFGVWMTAMAAGSLNNWQKEATGKRIWQPGISDDLGL